MARGATLSDGAAPSQALSFTDAADAQHGRFETVFNAVERTLAQINENVRAQEAQVGIGTCPAPPHAHSPRHRAGQARHAVGRRM
eukprot:1149728-Prymnesium_polylepis.1